MRSARPPWRTHRAALAHPIELSKTLLPRTALRRSTRRAPGRTGKGKPGLYRFYLAHTWSSTVLEDGHYDLEVEATDLSGNQGRLRQPFTITNDL